MSPTVCCAVHIAHWVFQEQEQCNGHKLHCLCFAADLQTKPSFKVCPLLERASVAVVSKHTRILICCSSSWYKCTGPAGDNKFIHAFLGNIASSGPPIPWLATRLLCHLLHVPSNRLPYCASILRAVCCWLLPSGHPTGHPARASAPWSAGHCLTCSTLDGAVHGCKLHHSISLSARRGVG